MKESATLNDSLPARNAPDYRRAAGSGFTMIELLAVIAIIGILAAILIPTMSKVRQSANNSRTRAMFSQWTTAIESFHQEYGYLPDFNSDPGDWTYTNPTADGTLIVRLNQHADRRQNFVEFLSGRMMDGSTLRDGWGPAASRHPNERGIQFYSFSESDYQLRNPQGSISDPANVYFVDAFGNSDIVIVMDHDGDGIITLRDNAAHQVRPGFADNLESYGAPPLESGQSEREIRARVLIYSPGRHGNNAGEVRQNIVKSWE